jgi:hypothetical protein
MDLTKADPGTDIVGQVPVTLWRQTVLTSCVLAACLALIAVLAMY